MALQTLDLRDQVHEALRFLADRCDGARSLDGENFHKIDASFGRQLADSSSLTLPQLVVGSNMIRKYRRQLESGGLHIPTRQEVEQYLAEQKTIMSRREALPAQVQKPAPADQPAHHRVYVEHRRIIVLYPYDRAIHAAIAPLKQKIQDWGFNRYGLKEWSYPLESVNLVLDALHPFEHHFSYSPEIAAVVEQMRHEEELACQQAELEQAFEEMERLAAMEAAQPFLDGTPLPNGEALFGHQREAVCFLIERKRMILAHDLGLGKTRSALIAAKSYGLPVFVICPAGLRINWLREAEIVQVPVEVYSWAKLPDPTEDHDYILIADEAHYAQTLSTKRTKGFLELAEHARAVYALTGTPMKNAQPINLFPLLVACRHPLAQDLRAYEHRYCNAHYKSIGRKREVWDVTGASHLDELHEKTKHLILYKKKEECLKDLPPKVRVMRQAEVDREGERAYQSMITQLTQEHQARMQQKRDEQIAALRQEVGADFDEEMLQDELEAMSEDEENARALVELGIMRHVASTAKVASALDLAQEVLEQGESIVLFTAYRDTATRLASELAAECLSGDTTTEERQAMIDRFQARQTHALVCMIGAGGVGITLTAAQTVVLVDRPWTPGDTIQCEDRCHRIGQRGSVTAIWLQYGLLDQQIDRLLQQKQERIDLVLRGKRKTMRGVSRSIRSMAKEILESVRSGVPLEQLLGELDEEQHDLVVEASTVGQSFSDSTAEPASATEASAARPRRATSPTTTSMPPAAVPAKKGKARRDRRLKGELPRVRMNVMLDEEVAAFLRSMKVPAQTTKEPGYSGFLERLVRESPEFQRRKS